MSLNTKEGIRVL